MLRRYTIIDSADPDSDILEAKKKCNSGVNLFANFFKNPNNFAPYLFPLDKGSAFEEWYFNSFWGKSIGLILFSSEKPKTIRNNLMQIIEVKTETRGKFYFRYYDPRVLKVFLPTCNEKQLKLIFKSIDTFVCEDEIDSSKVFSIDRKGNLIEAICDENEIRTFSAEINREKKWFF